MLAHLTWLILITLRLFIPLFNCLCILLLSSDIFYSPTFRIRTNSVQFTMNSYRTQRLTEKRFTFISMISVLWWCSHIPYPRSKISSRHLLHKGTRGGLSGRRSGVCATDPCHPALGRHSGLPDWSGGDWNSQWNVAGTNGNISWCTAVRGYFFFSEFRFLMYLE